MNRPASEIRWRFSVAAAGVVSMLAVGCQSTPPPATAPPRNPALQQPATGAPRSLPAPLVSCSPAAAASGDPAAAFDAIEGLELDLTAFGAALDALSASGTVDITTEDGGRPEFRTVSVAQLDRTLRAESDPVLAVEASRKVAATDLTTPDLTTPDLAAAEPLAANGADPLHVQQWSDWTTPYSPTWSCSRGAGVDIAVVDTGVDRSHPDLAGRVTTGGVSLDGAASVTPGAGGSDPHGHGTHVAGIAAASAGNGIGIAGVAPETRIIPVRVLGPSGGGWSSDVAAGITWAVDAGAEVVNLSLGTTWQSQAITNAITYARAAGVVVVAAAGNDGPTGPKNYPAADNRTIAVSSIDSDLAISGFSTQGSYVDVAAPGSLIVSTVPGGGYDYKSGTSMATPFVSGLAALMIGLDGSITPDGVASRLTTTANDAGAPGVDPAFGHGIVNPVRAMSR